MIDRVLSASCWVWVVGFDAMPQGLEQVLPTRIGEAVASGHGYLQVRANWESNPVRYPLVLAACGQRLDFDPRMVQAVDCGQPVVQVVGLVTTAREPKLEGHLVRPRGDKDKRRWLFLAGLDPYAFCRSSGLIHDPIVEEAGFVSVPSDMARERRKQILGFGEAR